MNDFSDSSPTAGRRPRSTISTPTARKLRKAMPPQEARVWVRLRRLRPQGIHFRRQVPIGNYVVDFACLKHRIVIELDGSQHGSDEHLRRDRIRDSELEAQGFRVIRFWNDAVRQDIDSVIETITAGLAESNSQERG